MSQSLISFRNIGYLKPIWCEIPGTWRWFDRCWGQIRSLLRWDWFLQQWVLWMLKLVLLPCFYWCCEKYIPWKGLFPVDTIIFKITFPHLPVVESGPWASTLLLNCISSPAPLLLYVFHDSASPSENVEFVLGFCFVCCFFYLLIFIALDIEHGILQCRHCVWVPVFSVLAAIF